MSLCNHYNNKTQECDMKQCNQGNRANSGKCLTEGEIFDKFKNGDVNNYEYKQNYKR